MSSPLRFQIFPEACNRHIHTRPDIYIKKQFVALVILYFNDITNLFNKLTNTLIRKHDDIEAYLISQIFLLLCLVFYMVLLSAAPMRLEHNGAVNGIKVCTKVLTIDMHSFT